MVCLRVCNQYRDNGKTTRIVNCTAVKRHLSNDNSRSSHAAAVSAIVTIEHDEPRINFGYLSVMLCLSAG
jgi:hypothetical protein